MKDTLTYENLRDFNQRYSQSYGYLLKDNGTRLPVFITNVSEDGAEFQSLDGVEFNAKCGSGVTFEFAQIARRIWLSMEGQLLCTSRIPQRQWQRGISAGNTQCYHLTHKGPMQAHINHTVMRGILFDNPNKQTKGNILLSDQFAISGELVYLYHHVIGEYDVDNKIVKLEKQFSMFQQEVIDATKPFNIGVKHA